MKLNNLESKTTRLSAEKRGGVCKVSSKRKTSPSIDFNMTLKEAVESKRFHHQWLPDYIQIEPRTLINETINELTRIGHNLYYRSSIGEANCIMIDYNNNLKFGVSDSRRGGTALSY